MNRDSEIISLNRDIQFVQNYIGLMRIRYTDAVDIRVEYPHDLPPQVSIPPLLLIVFVENAFKHGVSYSKPSFIHMRIGYAGRRGRRPPSATAVTNSPQAEKHYAGIASGERPQTAGADLRPGQLFALVSTSPIRAVYTVKLVIPTLQCLNVSP